MIVKMKKAFVIVRKEDMVSAVNQLRDMGTVHVEHLDPLEGDQLFHLREEVSVLSQAVAILKQTMVAMKPEALPRLDWRDHVNEIIDLWTKMEHYQEDIRKFEAEINQWKPWGDFDPIEIEALAKEGIYFYLSDIPKKDCARLPVGIAVEIIQSGKNSDLCVLVARQTLDLPNIVAHLPAMSLGQMILSQKELHIKLNQAEKKIQEECRYVQALEKIFLEHREELHLEETIVGMKDEGAVAILKGYLPMAQCAELETKSKQHGWGLSIEEPSDEDAVPTLIRNPRWIGMITPVFQFMNSIPGYRELDVSFLFLLFLSIFFGILIGDAGYGILFFAGMAWAHKKFGPKMKNHSLFYLIYTMSSFAIVWGFLTGTFFGTKLFGSFVKPLMPWLTLNENVQLVCFILGAIHLSIAHIWRAINRINSVTALAEIGWILIVWGCFFFTRMLILNQPLPSYINIILYAGPALVILFNQPRKNIMAQMGLGLGDFLLNVMSFFGDTVSYIRLFAVGLAGVSVADAFNQMALSAGFKSIGMGIIAVMVLLIGHTLNMILACFGVLVHGIRLNLLEFSAHLGMEWTGKEYDPLKKTS